MNNYEFFIEKIKDDNNIATLNKVKELILLPEMEMLSAGQLANYYEVGQPTINKLTLRHLDELSALGMQKMTYKEVKQQLSEVSNVENILPFISRKGTYYYPKRAILSVGMLLKNSKVAKRLRAALLDQQEETSLEEKITAIGKERELIFDYLYAETKEESDRALEDYLGFMNTKFNM